MIFSFYWSSEELKSTEFETVVYIFRLFVAMMDNIVAHKGINVISVQVFVVKAT